jgi:hypothetical protein
MVIGNLSEPAKAVTFSAILVARVGPLAMMFWLLRYEPAGAAKDANAGAADRGQELLLG